MSGEGRARLEAALLRDQAEILELCGAEQEKLTAAQEAYEADPTPETLAAYEEAQQSMYELRGWLRAGAQEAAANELPAAPPAREPRARAARSGRRREGEGES
ncbi:hypothetical protein [Microbispora sp. CA-102843]|uniref:hypothetical protein n=1 Tax=Microbispora sp. CA-102843 TaxID=3239952 RepID=UPI003D8D8F7A